MGRSPDAVATEKVIAVKFAHIGRVVLEPLEIEFLHSMEFVFRIFEVLGEVQLEMAMMPVRVAGLMHLAGIAFRAPAGSVALQAETAVLDESLLSVLVVKHVAADVGGSVGIGIIGLEQGIPLAKCHGDVYFRDAASVKDIGKALFGRIAAVVAAAAGIVAAAVVLAVILAVIAVIAVVAVVGCSVVQRVLVTGRQNRKCKQRRQQQRKRSSQFHHFIQKYLSSSQCLREGCCCR